MKVHIITYSPAEISYLRKFWFLIDGLTHLDSRVWKQNYMYTTTNEY